MSQKKLQPKTRIKRETERLQKIFADLDENKKDLIQPLIERAAFIRISMEDLEEELLETGWTETYKNGKDQEGVKKSAAAASYVKLVTDLNAIVRQLLDIVPAKRKASKLEGFLDEA